MQPALADLGVGDVGEPRRVGAACLEPALDQVVRGLPLGSALLAGRSLGARARDAVPASLPHDARHALARGAHPERPQPHERPGRAVDAPNLVSDLGYRDGKLLVAQGVRARRARFPGVMALRAAFSAAHISDTGQLGSLRVNSNSALFAEAPTAACRRRRRSLLKVSRSRA